MEYSMAGSLVQFSFLVAGRAHVRRLRTVLVVLAACTGLDSAGQAAEQGRPSNYPNKPIRILDGFPPGGATNFISRVVGEKLTERLGQPIVIDNRPGAGSNLAAGIAAKATPDGYTIFMALTSTLAPAPNLYTRLPFNLINDFTYIGLVASGNFVLVVHPALPTNSVQELVTYAQTKSGQLRYGSGGIATPLHLAMELLQHRTGAKMIHVPFKGAGPLVVSLTAGEIELGFSSVTGALPMVKAARLRALAVSGAKRAVVLPHIPTVAESGFPNFDITGRYGLIAPAGTPAAVVQALNAEFIKIAANSDVQTRFVGVGLEAVSSTPAQFHKIMRDEVEQWAQVIRAANIPPLE
jgi:tripartite-type tricarboxylate transporter receptor subunit TctC